MLSASNEFRQQLNSDNRNYVIKIDMTLNDGTILTLDNSDIWGDGITISEATSSDSSLDIGSAIIGSCTINLDNITDKFSEYDFYNATFTIYLGLVLSDGTTEYIKRGFYTVDEAEYNGSIITLSCLDNMWTFDTDYSEVNTSYSNGVSCATIIRDIVVHCLGSATYLATQTFPNSAFVLYERPSEDMNCREVIAYITQICGCYAKMNVNGQLVIAWYDTSANISTTDYDGGSFSTKTKPYSDGDDVEGGQYYWDGTTYVWTDTANYEGGSFTSYDKAYITKNSTIQVGTDDITITGIRVYNSGSGDDAYDYTVGKTGYILAISDNPFITLSNYKTIASMIYSAVDEMMFRTFTSSTLNDVTYESGDACEINDFRGNRYYSYITHLTFKINNYEDFGCGAESPNKNLTVRYSESVKTLVEAERRTTEQLSNYDVAVQQMNMLASNMMGVYFGYTTDETGATVSYSSNKPFTYDSDGKLSGCTVGASVWKRNAEGYFICSKATSTDLSKLTFASGIDNTGNITARVISTIGLQADWITSGTLTLGGSNTNTHGKLSVLDSNDKEQVSLNSAGLTMNKGSINLASNFIVDANGVVTIKSGSIKLGAVYNNNGTISGYKFVVDNNGCVTMKNGTIQSSNYDYASGNFSTEGTQIDLAKGRIRSPKFAIDESGNAYYSGSLSASQITTGTISASMISTDKLSAISSNLGTCTSGTFTTSSSRTAYDSKLSGLTMTTSGIGAGNGSACTFKVVASTGKLTATNADITGKITSTEGKIGSFEIKTSDLEVGDAILNESRMGCGKAGLGIVNIVGNQTGDSSKYGYIQISNSGSWDKCLDGIRIYGSGLVRHYDGDGDNNWSRWLSNIPEG